MAPTNSNTIFVTFWGTRGSISTPGSKTEKYGGNTPCVSLRYNDTDIIIDAGTGIRNLGLHLAEEAEEQNAKLNLHLLLSHTHWDHIQGLPFFAPAYMKGTKMAIYGSPQKESFLESILQRQMDVNYFPVDMNALAAELRISEISEDTIKIGRVTVDWQEQICHPGGSVRYRINAANKKVVYATDVELDKVFPNEHGEAQDKKLSDEYCRFIQDADLLIADGQYTKEEYRFRLGWGHTSIPLIIDIAYRSNVKQLAIFHHEPQHSDAMLDKLWGLYGPKYSAYERPMNIFWAREGMTLPI